MSAEGEGGFDRVNRSTPTERQIRFATEKLMAGYSLIVSDERKSAVFFRTGKGYEGCAFRVARSLVTSGFAQSAGRHPLGTIYLADPDRIQASKDPAPKTPFSRRYTFQVPRSEEREVPSGETDADGE
jgi:hypothetical protein